MWVGESLGSMGVMGATTGAAHSGASLFTAKALLEVLRRRVEGGRRGARGAVGTFEMRVRRGNNNRRVVDVGFLHVNGVVVLVFLVDLGVENAGDGHIETLTLVVARWASNGSASIGGSTLLKGTHSGDLRTLHDRCAEGHRDPVRRRVDILVLQMNGVVIIAPLVHVGVGLHVGRVRADEAAITVIARWATDGSTANLGGGEAMLLLSTKISWVRR